MRAEAVISQDGKRIDVHTRLDGTSFDEMLDRVKRVPGARFRGADKVWHYPLAIDTCHALRSAFGKDLRVGVDLSRWYRAQAAEAAGHAELARAQDATLTRVSAAFSAWLRPYQRVGAQWIAEGYRNGGLVADTPGVGKTSETIAGVLEAGLTGPVLVVCPKGSVRRVWGKELAQHAPEVPTYLCYGTRQRREKVLAQFAADVAADPHALRFVVIVAEMLRVVMGDPCFTQSGAKVATCQHLLQSTDDRCPLHQRHRAAMAAQNELTGRRAKERVAVGFSFPELFSVHGLRGGWSGVILDESHKMLGSLTIAKGNLMGRGLRLLPERADVRRYALSGTPFGKGGRVQGMFGTLHWLWPDEYPSFWRWAEAWFEVEHKKVKRNMVVRKVQGLKGLSESSTPEEEAAAIEGFLRTLGPRVLRRTKAEVLPDLPPKTYIEVVCDMTPQQRKQYTALADYAEVSVDGGVVAPNGGLALMTRERQIANGALRMGSNGKVAFTDHSGKLDALWEKMDERGILDHERTGTKIVVASEFNEYLDALCGRLKADHVRHLRIDGKTPEDRREAIVDAWQNGTDPARVLVVNSVAAGISITLDAADEMHIMDERWNPEENEQLEDRIHRASRNHQVTIYYYRTEGTIDYVKAHSVEMKRRAQHAVLDGSRGVQYIREMMADSLADEEE